MKQTIQKLLVVTAMLSTGITAFAVDFKVDGIYYDILSEEERTVEVTRYNNWSPSYSGDIIIPERIIYNSTTYKVVSIGDNAFKYSDDLTSVSIPNSVTTIGREAFYGSDGLTSVKIPNSVTTIGEDAFSECKGLIEINVDDNNKEYSSIDGVLYNKDVSELICYPCGMPLNSFSIPNSVTKIGNSAFSGCDGLTSVTIPNSVMTIGEYAFFSCTCLTSVTIGNNVTTIGGSAFSRCKSLTSVTIPNSVTTIEYEAFQYCEGLTSVTIGNSVTTIGSRAFYNCNGLTSVTIPNSVTTIMHSTFAGCTGLTSVTIPNSVTTIEDSAFSSCKDLTSVTIPNSVTTIGNDVFSGCDGLTSVTIGYSVTTIGNNAFLNCDGLTSVTIGYSVTTIGEDAFSGCGNIKEIYCQPVIPPSGDIAIFADEALMNATLYVPTGSKEEYEQVDPWRNFWNIEEHYFAGVEDVVGSDVDVTAENGRIIVTSAEEGTRIEVYSVAGQLIYSGTDTTINAPSAGLYIVQVAGEAFKVILQ